MALAAGFRAFAGASEITGVLSADHLDPFAITLTPPYLEPMDPSAPASDALAAAGAVSQRDGKTLAAWTIERTLTVRVPGGPVAVLATSWQARPAYDYLPANRTQAGPRLAPYCLNTTSLAEALGQPKDPGALVGREYAVPAGIGGRAPATVSLDVTGAVPDEGRRLLIAACGMEGQLVLGRDRLVGARVRPSSDGTVHVLTVGDAAAGD